MTDPAFYTILEVVSLTRTSKTFIYNQVRGGKLRLTRMGPKKVLVSKKDLEAFLFAIEQETEAAHAERNGAGKAA